MNAINTDLLQATMLQVEAHKQVVDGYAVNDPEAADQTWDKGWDQTCWRHIEVAPDRCRTSMCFAGWTVEAAQAQWLVTTAMAREIPRERLALFVEYVLVDDTWRAAHPDAFEAKQVKDIGNWSGPTPEPLAHLAEAWVVPARTYAQEMLGLSYSDQSVLFHEDNSLETLQTHVAQLLEQGYLDRDEEVEED